MGFTPPNGGVRGASVSIPFIAGQWSLNASPPPHEREGARFQSPSLRGSGRLGKAITEADAIVEVSIPFIAGQWSLRAAPRASGAPAGAFQSPSLRGSGRFCDGGRGPPRPIQVSIPFIAGQWSLEPALGGVKLALACFNPLHCGAVVAWMGWEPERALVPGCFNPLHCGAVVASCAVARAAAAIGVFQSPSLRGSGRLWRR